MHGPLTSVVLAAGACCTSTQAQDSTTFAPPPADASSSSQGPRQSSRLAALDHSKSDEEARPVQFDLEILRERGLSPTIGEYFRDGPRFQMGAQWVAFNVNGDDIGRRRTSFDATGRLCITATLAASLGLKAVERPGGVQAGASAVGDCPDQRVHAPRAVIVLRPSEGAVEITVPPEDMMAMSHPERMETGGVGALLNYRAYAYESRTIGAQKNASRYLDTELGFNAGDWIVRSHQMYSQNAGIGHYRWQSAYAQRTFVEHKQVLQAGRITTRGSLFAGLPLTGAQWFPERGLKQLRNYPVSGVAATRARVEIRQNGMLLHSTVVPPGPFTVSDYPLVDKTSDLRVSIVEENGNEQIMTVPAASLLLLSDNTQNEGLTMAAGQLWSAADVRSYDNVPVVTGAYGWARGNLTGTLGGLLSRQYASAAMAANWKVAPHVSSFAQMVASRDGGRDRNGAQGSAALAWLIGEHVSVGVSGNLRSAGYRTVQEAASVIQAPISGSGARSQAGATVSMNLEGWGAVSAGITRTSYFDAQPGTTYSASWGVGWRQVSLQVGVSRSSTTTASAESAGFAPYGVQRAPIYLYVNLSIALGSGVTISSYGRRTDDVTYYGASIDQRVNDTVAYRLSAERSSGIPGTEASGSVNVLPRYASVSLGLSDRQTGRSYYGEITGSMLATPSGVGFSPYPVQDTFGVIRTGNVVGLKVDTPQGPVWSGPGGIVAVPALLAYQASRLEAALTGKALNVDVADPSQVVRAGRGAVLDMTMDARRVRRVLLTVTDAQDVVLPAGLPVLRGGNEFFSSTARGGRVMVDRMQEDDILYVELPTGQRCMLQDVRTRARGEGELFESGTAACR